MKSSNIQIDELPVLGIWGFPNFVKGEKINMPSGDFVVSYDKNNLPISIFRDYTWKFVYGKRALKTCSVNFISWLKKSHIDEKDKILISELKYLFGLILWFRPQGPISAKSLGSKMVILRKMAKFARGCNISIYKIFGEKQVFNAFIASSLNYNFTEFASIVVLLQHLGESSTGIKLISPRQKNQLDFYCNKLQETKNQVPPIPPRLYMNWISDIQGDLNFVEKYIPKIVAMLNSQKIHTTSARGGIKKLIQSSDFDDFFLWFRIPYTRNGFATALGIAQRICMYVIITFSGMRLGEAEVLPYDCIVIRTRAWGKSILLSSITTKGNRLGRESEEQWVTNNEGARAVEVARIVAQCVYRWVPNYEGEGIYEFPFLFVSTGYLTSVSKRKRIDIGVARSRMSMADKSGKKILENYHLKVVASDIGDLERIVPSRNWINHKKYKLGTVWPVSHQQLRRSLAMYASASGLVTLQTLKKQLKHLTREMSRYYTNGYRNLVELTGQNEDHFAHEYIKLQLIAQEQSYVNNVVESKEKIFGGHGAWVEQNLKSPEIPIFQLNRDAIHKDFLRGKLAYKETVLGGCTTVVPCEKHMMRIFTECDGCSKGVILPSKLNRAIKIMTIHTERMPADSVESRTDISELNALLELRTKIMNKNHD